MNSRDNFENRRRDRDQSEDERRFQNRPGALDRRWGYSGQLDRDIRHVDPGQDWAEEYEFEDDHEAPDYWQYQREWMRPGPFTGLGPRNHRRSDASIFEDVCHRLTQHAEIDARDIEVEVEDGEVTLKGTVEDRRTKRMVEANVDRIFGVIDVHNRLRLRDREEARREQRGEKPMDNPFPGGPTPTGNAGYDENIGQDR